jgi:colanic acid/amylovoran biosynthesis glycosyltransferase
MDELLVYRDLLGAKSEGFVAMQYLGFTRLKPFFVGTRGAPPGAGMRIAEGPLGRFRARQLGAPGTALTRWIETQRPRAVHAQFGLGGALALPIARRFDLPLFVTFHGGDATKETHYRRRWPVPTIYQRRMSAMIDRARLIFCVSDYLRDVLIGRGFPPRKLLTHHLGIELPKKPLLPPYPLRTPNVLLVARLVEKKGVDVAIDAMAQLRTEAPELVLGVVGDGPLRAVLEQRVRTTGAQVQFLGWHTPDAVRARMREAAMLLIPSRRASTGDAEGLGLVTLEAQSVGCPVIGSRHGGIPEAVLHEQTGLLVPEGDAGALAASILRLRREAGLAERLRVAAFERLLADFDARKQSAWLEQILLSMTGGDS